MKQNEKSMPCATLDWCRRKQNIRHGTINWDQQSKDGVLYQSLRSQTCILWQKLAIVLLLVMFFQSENRQILFGSAYCKGDSKVVKEREQAIFKQFFKTKYCKFFTACGEIINSHVHRDFIYRLAVFSYVQNVFLGPFNVIKTCCRSKFSGLCSALTRWACLINTSLFIFLKVHST